MDRVARRFCSSFPGPGGPSRIKPPPIASSRRARSDNPGPRWIRPPGPELGPQPGIHLQAPCPDVVGRVQPSHDVLWT
ncbi:hypothetical protein TYRP_023633, partial [Tyrophagus putrescentiae]